MKKFILPLLIIILAGTAFTPAQNTITRSAITFKIKNLGITTGGTIGGLQASIQFNPASLATSGIEASVDVNTINTDNSTRDEHLKSDEFFDAPHYPKISLKSVSFKHRSGNNFTGQFNLTIKDKTKLVEIPFTYTDKGSTMGFTGSFKINRLDYGVGSSSMVMSDDVIVSIDAEAVK
jgi:polyisoprenoid-binding protein YceI